MAKSDELLNLDVVALSEHFRARELSPVEVTEAYLKRIEETEPRLHAYVTVTADVARNTARDAEKGIMAGRRRGALHGVPVALKDLCNTRGILRTSGSKVLRDNVPAHES